MSASALPLSLDHYSKKKWQKEHRIRMKARKKYVHSSIRTNYCRSLLHCHLFVPLCLSRSFSFPALFFRLAQKDVCSILFLVVVVSFPFFLDFFVIISNKKRLCLYICDRTGREKEIFFHLKWKELQLHFHSFDGRISWRTRIIRFNALIVAT